MNYLVPGQIAPVNIAPTFNKITLFQNRPNIFLY